VPVLMLLSGIGDFFNAIMWGPYAAMSFVLMYAYRGWSMVTGADTGLTWALSIMTLTVIVRTLLIPLFIRQINSARNMQLIQPKLKELQDKYGADRNQLGIETQKLFKDEGVNPLASCFPMLLQMPVFMALYWVLYGAANNNPVGYFFVHNPALVESLTHAELFGARLAGRFWLTDWSQFGATQVFAIILTILMVTTLFITQKQVMSKNMSPEAMTGQFAQQQKMMLYLFPAMYIFLGAWIVVGVMVYWVTSNTWTLVQQWLLIRNNPTPGTPAYIDWEERMIRQGKDPKQIAEDRLNKRRKTPNMGTGSRTVGQPKPGTTGKDGLRHPYNKKDDEDGEDDGDDAAGTGTGTGKGPGGKGPGGSGDAGGSGQAEPPRVQRQQIQRQQPRTESRANRTTKKKK